MKSVGLYIHIPWCLRKCPYCDFNSHTQRGASDESTYVEALLLDLRDDLRTLHHPDSHTPVVIDSVFFGGGTPSIFSASAIATIIEGVDRQLSLSHDCEITLEANPGASEQARFSGYRAAGVNRLSIGIQSFDATQLSTLGRIHSADEAQRAIQMARQAGFDNYNLDMMFALPGQTLSEARDDLRQLIDADPTHISYYQLTIEPNTYFYAHPPAVLDDELQADIQLQGQALLAEAGFTQYEVSAYAKPHRQCRHNRHYWQFDDYLGIGAGAHGKWTTPSGEVTRSWKHKQPHYYQTTLQTQHTAAAERATITDDRLLFEYLLNRLRLYEPIRFQDIATKIPHWSPERQTALCTTLNTFVQDGLLSLMNDPYGVQQGFTLTEQGRLFMNRILMAFLPDESD